MDINAASENNQIKNRYTIAKGINGILWIWEKINHNLWKVYPYEQPQAFHYEDDLGNKVNTSIFDNQTNSM